MLYNEALKKMGYLPGSLLSGFAALEARTVEMQLARVRVRYMPRPEPWSPYVGRFVDAVVESDE